MAELDPSATAAERKEEVSFSLILMALMGQQILGALAFPLAKYSLDFINPYVFAFYRFILAAVLLLIVTRSMKWERPVAREDYKIIVGLGLLIIMLNQVTYLIGQSLTAAGHGALLFATTPVWIYILARLHLKERMTWRRSTGIVLAVAGVMVIMSAGAINVGIDYLWGDLIIFVSVLAWAYYAIIGKPLVRKYGALRVTAYALASGTVFYLPYGFYEALQFDYGAIPLKAWSGVVYMAIGASFFAYVLWYWVLKHMEASRVAVFHNFQPIFASIVAYIFLGEPLGTAFVLGGLVVLTGVIIAETGSGA